jgi:1-acyl-sn-glycerol-3-phosphate acyltransferase
MQESKNQQDQVSIQEKSKFPRFKSNVSPAYNFDYNYPTDKLGYRLVGPFFNTYMKGFRVKIEGRENIPKDTNVILMPNHISHSDSAFVVPPIYKSGPFHFISDEKLFRSKPFRKLAKMMNVFPIKKKAKAMFVVEHAIKKVNEGDSLLWYPEGQRHKNPSENKCNPGKLGSGMIAHAVDVPIIPVFLAGSEFAMPIGRKPQVGFGMGFRYIDVLVRYGKPVPLDDLRQLPAGKETSQKVVDRIIEHIEALRNSNGYIDQSHKLK